MFNFLQTETIISKVTPKKGESYLTELRYEPAEMDETFTIEALQLLRSGQKFDRTDRHGMRIESVNATALALKVLYPFTESK